jgi:S-(hydroxymethyl)glutathione dehydrogenase/alcohol dehydrogenase
MGRAEVRAAVFTEVGAPLQVETVTNDSPGPQDVVVRLSATGVCHTDLAIMNGDLPWPAPSILGHEGTGVVEAVGSAVTRVRPGDRVVGAGVPACGDCFYCVGGQSHLCEQTFTSAARERAVRGDGARMSGFGGLGTFAEAMTVDESSLVPVQTDLPAEQLALIGCAVPTGVGAALHTAAVTPGSTVAVIGCGGVGQCVVQGARIAGAARIIAVDPMANKRAAAGRQGATDVVDPAAADPVQQIRELTSGRGVDVAFEVVGRPDTIEVAYRAARRGGVVVVVGMPAADAQVSFSAFELFVDAKEIRVSTLGGTQIRRDIPRLVALAETGRLDLSAMVTRRYPLERINDAVSAMVAGEVIRGVIAFD